MESQEGKGSEFSFTIPMRLTKAAPLVPQIQGYDCPSFRGRRVLLAEDNELNAEIAQTFLETCDLQVDVVANGKQALEKFVNQPDYCYSLILLDIQMPVMDGNAAAIAIRSSEKPDAQAVPILAMSANAFTEDIQKSLQAGINGYLAKPVDMRVLIDTISGYLSPGS